MTAIPPAQPRRSPLPFRLVILGVLIVLIHFIATTADAQIPDKFINLKHFPADITRDSLIGVMRSFSFALGVRCQYCHVGGDGVSFEGVEFDKDDDPDKRKARAMLAMVDRINTEVLTDLPDRDDPPSFIECKTCHRGLPKPTLLSREIRRLVDSAGAPAATTKVKEWRERIGMSGIYDFGEWETNVAAERLERDGRLQDAIGVYEMNFEYYPRSSAIAGTLGRLYEATGDTTTAIRWYERTLELQADHRRAKERLAALKGGN